MSQQASQISQASRPRTQTRAFQALPGLLTIDPNAPMPVITVIAYGPDDLVEKRLDSPPELLDYLSKWPVVWINIDGLNNLDLLSSIATLFSIHHLALEDVLTVHQRAKFERYGDVYYLICHMVEDITEVQTEQLNVFLGKNFVITMQDGPIDSLDPARERIRKGLGSIRSMGPDYLVCSLVDTIVDGYFPILEKYGERLDLLEDEMIDRPARHTIADIHVIKRNLLTLRRTIWPLREAINSLLRDAPEILGAETVIHLRDCYTHSVQIIDFIETYRELGADLMDVYLSSISNKMNEVMKVLAVITTLCGPPSLVASIYGMNFKTEASPFNMPELGWYYGYPIALGVMLTLFLMTFSLMWSKGWLSALTGSNNTDGRHDRNPKS